MARKKLINIKSIKLRPRKTKTPKIEQPKSKPPQQTKPAKITVKQALPKVAKPKASKQKIEKPKKKEKYKRKKLELKTVKTKQGKKKLKGVSSSKKRQKAKRIKKQMQRQGVSDTPMQSSVLSGNIIDGFKNALEEMLSMVNPYSRKRSIAIDSVSRIENAIDNAILNYGEDKVAQTLEELQASGELEIGLEMLYNSQLVAVFISKMAGLLTIDDSLEDVLDVLGDDFTMELYGTYLEQLL